MGPPFNAFNLLRIHTYSSSRYNMPKISNLGQSKPTFLAVHQIILLQGLKDSLKLMNMLLPTFTVNKMSSNKTNTKCLKKRMEYLTFIAAWKVVEAFLSPRNTLRVFWTPSLTHHLPLLWSSENRTLNPTWKTTMPLATHLIAHLYLVWNIYAGPWLH